MNKRILSFMMVICLLLCMFPTAAFAEDPEVDTTKDAYYKNYTAIGDSICAGFAQSNYEYVNGFKIDDNIENSPTSCYARKVGERLGSTVYNLGKCGCDSTELLDILTKDNSYHNTYLDYIGKSDLITLEIGSNDLLMAVVDKILDSAGTKMTHQQAMALVEPLLTRDIDGIVNLIQTISHIELTEDQINAIKDSLSDEALDDTLKTAYETFIKNFPDIITNLRLINQSAELVIINYYNPFNITDSSTKINTINIIQNYIDQMNSFTGQHCSSNGLLYVNISEVETNMDLGMPDPHPSENGHTDIANGIVNALISVNATAQTGGTITPSGENIVKTGSTLAFEIAAADGYTISDVKVDGDSKGALTEYKFEKINGDHSISAEFSNGTTPSPTPTPTPPDKPYYNIYTALGDSITAGYTRPYYDGDYSNPETGYVALAATQLGVKRENNNNLGLLGLDSGGLLDILNDKSEKYSDRFINDLTASDLISIDIGSNDLTMALLDLIFDSLGYNMTNEQKFEKIEPYLNTENNEIKLESLEDLKQLDPKITDEQIDNLFNALINEDNIRKKFEAAYANFTVNWDSIILKIRDMKPKAAIVALGYYNVTPELSFDYKGKSYKIFEKKSPEEKTIGEEYVGYMNQYISTDSKVSRQYIYVDTTGVELLSLGKITIDPHPSKDGHADLANRLKNAVLNVITVTAGVGGTVSPGTKTVAYGLTDNYTYTYTFTPDTGNSIVDVSVDGKSVGTPGNYIFKEITADHTISVTFDKNAPAPDPVVSGGGGDSRESFYVKTDVSKGGKIALSNSAPYERGANVTLTITPDEGYITDYILYDGEKIANTDTITIRSISAHHSVYVAFKESEEVLNNSNNPFTDVKSTDWFYKEAMYMYINKIMRGTSGTTFDPNVAVSRAMIVAILYRMENEPTVTNKGEYTDVAKDTWYTNAVLWAAEKGILKGYGNGKLGPEDEVTREQIVNILYQYAVFKGYNTSATANLSSYNDTAKVSDWASTAMQWAVKEGLINGKNNQLDPSSTATRAEIAAIIYRFIEKY